MAGFNPHPTRRSGATRGTTWEQAALRCFNPHPTRRSGATNLFNSQQPWVQVSILTRPEGRVQLGLALRPAFTSPVSILTRPEGRVQHVDMPGHGSNERFQSSPDPKVGCNVVGQLATRHQSLFQSSPDPKVGCNADLDDSPALIKKFQSSPDPKVGCNARPTGWSMSVCLFQSSPDPKVGCNPYKMWVCDAGSWVSILTRPEGRVQRALTVALSPPQCCFNPHPTRRSGATTTTRRRTDAIRVSILTRPEGRVQPAKS